MQSIIRYAAFFLLLLSSLGSRAQVIRFGVIADIQYADADTRGTRLYRNSVQKLEEAITDLNKQKMPFLINLGDVVDRNPADFTPVLKEIRKFRRPVYTTTGNHDYHGIKSNDSLYRLLDMPAAYYSFKKGNWRFIMLNTNEVAAYANVQGTALEQELQEMMEKIRARKGRNGAEYNGGISSVQMKWLQEQLTEAQQKGEKVLVFSHHPLGCAEGLSALNDQEIVALIEKYDCVKALISGHHHAGAFCMVGKLPCIVLEGMVETEENSYGTVALYPDKMEITGTGRMTSRTINF